MPCSSTRRTAAPKARRSGYRIAKWYNPVVPAGGRGAPRPPAGTTGLYHFAILYPDRRALGAAVRRVLEHGIPLEGASDHGVSEAVYLRDPDGNGVELYCDRPAGAWPRTPDGALVMHTRPLDVEDLLKEAGQRPGNGR